MEKDKLESLLIDYIDGKLNEVDKHKVEQELMKNEEAYKLYEQFKEVMHAMEQSSRWEPSMKMKASFDEMLQQEMQSVKKTKTVFFNPAFYRVAAAVALLIVGGGVGFWISQYQRQQDEIVAMKKEIQQTKELMLARLENEQSPGQRILGIQASYDVPKADDEIVEALIKTMNEDPNSNVRLAAIDALKRLNADTKVRKALIASLSTQTDPVVQIALIQLMVEIKEKEAVKSLQKIIERDEVLPVVKDEAHAGIFKLS